MPGVSCVLLLGSFENRGDPQVIENMIRKVELLGGVRQGRLQISSAIYFATQMRSRCKSFQVITNTEYPATCFVLTDGHTCLMADLAFREFPGLLRAHYQRKKKLQIEGKGIKYKLGDFGISFITLFMGQSATVKGYLVEVTFQASNTIHLCGTLLRAFITQVIPEVCAPPPSAVGACADSATLEHVLSPTFHCAMQAGSLDPRNQGGSQPVLSFDMLGALLSPATTELQQTGQHNLDSARFVMTQYAEHINTVRRLSRQPVGQPVAPTCPAPPPGAAVSLDGAGPPGVGDSRAGMGDHYTGYLSQKQQQQKMQMHLKMQAQHQFHS